MTLTRPLVRPRFAKASAIVFVLLVPFVAHAVWDYVEARRLRVRLDAVAARGEPLTDRPTSGELNRGAGDADRFYRAAAALAVDLYHDIPSTIGHRMSVALREGVWPPELVAILRAKVDHYAEALAFVDRAAAHPLEWFPPGTKYDEQTGSLLTLARLCDWRAIVRAVDGEGDAAAASLYSEARLGRALRRYPPSFAAVPFALDRAAPSAAARARLADALAPLDRDDRLKEEFLRVRAMLLDDYRLASWRLWPPFSTLRRHLVVGALDHYAAAVRAAEQPWPGALEAAPAFAVSPARANVPPSRVFFESVVKGQARMIKSIRCARFHVSGGALKLVDPFTGRFLAVADCRL
jgi:hypothetical protein